MLKSQAMRIWPFVESEYEPPQKQLDTVTIDDDINLTGVELARFSFMGAEHVVDSWIDMYQQVLIQLHENDKSVLTRLAVCDDSSVELSAHFATSETSLSYSKKIDHNVFVWARLDTQYKIAVLRKLFLLFGVEPIELVFFLRRSSEATTSDEGRYAIRRKYWAYALPIIRESAESFENVNPTQGNFCNGYLGISGVHLCVVANLDSARAELYIEMPDKRKNKELFDYLHDSRATIEGSAGREFVWERNDECKSSKIYLYLDGVGIADETDWQRIATFHADGCNAIVDAFRDYIARFFE